MCVSGWVGEQYGEGGGGGDSIGGGREHSMGVGQHGGKGKEGTAWGGGGGGRRGDSMGGGGRVRQMGGGGGGGQRERGHIQEYRIMGRSGLGGGGGVATEDRGKKDGVGVGRQREKWRETSEVLNQLWNHQAQLYYNIYNNSLTSWLFYLLLVMQHLLQDGHLPGLHIGQPWPLLLLLCSQASHKSFHVSVCHTCLWVLQPGCVFSKNPWCVGMHAKHVQWSIVHKNFQWPKMVFKSSGFRGNCYIM